MVSILTTRNVLNLLEPDTHIDTFGRLLTYHKLVSEVFIAYIIIRLYDEAQLICYKAKVIC